VYTAFPGGCEAAPGACPAGGGGGGGGGYPSPGAAPAYGPGVQGGGAYSGAASYSGAGAGTGGFGGGFQQQAAQAAFNDPALQQHIRNQAFEQAQQGWNTARDGLGEAIQQLGGYVQEGPAGVSILCFLGGLATTIVGVLGILNFTSMASSPFQYVLNLYLTLFGVVTFLLEADVEAVRKLRILGALAPWVERYQMEVFNRAQFLTELRGRGLFFVFVGSLAITQCVMCLLFFVGIWNLFMGVVCVMMSYGINPVLPSDPRLAPQPGMSFEPQNQAPLNNQGF